VVIETDLYLGQTVASGTLDRLHVVDLDGVDELGCERVVQMMADTLDVPHKAHHVRHSRRVGRRDSSVDFVLDPCIPSDSSSSSSLQPQSLAAQYHRHYRHPYCRRIVVIIIFIIVIINNNNSICIAP